MGTHPIFESDFDCLTECCHVFLFFALLQSEPRLFSQTCHINIMNLSHTSQLISWNSIIPSIIKLMSTISMSLMKPCKKQSMLEMLQNKFNSTTESNSMVVVISTTPSSGRICHQMVEAKQKENFWLQSTVILVHLINSKPR